jgi:flagellar hook-length control protein FliK
VQPAHGEGAQREPAPGVVSAGAAAAVQVAEGRVTQASAERAEPDMRELKAEARAAVSAGESPRTAAVRGEAGPWQEPRADVGPQAHPQPQSQAQLDPEVATVGAPAPALHAAGIGPSAPAAANAPVVSLQGPERTIPERAVLLAEQGGGSARIQLRPPELGEVELVVRVRGRRVEVHVRAEEIGAQQVVLEGRERLGDALAAKDLRMEEFRVSLSGGDAGASERRGERGAFEPQPEPGWARAPGAHVDPDETPRTARVANANANARGIDLRV